MIDWNHFAVPINHVNPLYTLQLEQMRVDESPSGDSHRPGSALADCAGAANAGNLRGGGLGASELTTKTRRHEVNTETYQAGRLSADTERIAGQIVDSAYKVHSTLGPGLLESVYEACMVRELENRGTPSLSRSRFPSCMTVCGSMRDCGWTF